MILDLPLPGEHSLVFLPDTQIYSAQYPEHFLAQMRWVVAQRERFNIQAVLHVGDVVDDHLPEQWAAADAAVRVLEAAGVPYLLAIGNHDYETIGDADRRATGFNATFPPSRYQAQAWWRGGFYEDGHSENAYYRFTLGDTPALALSLEFGPRQAVIDWANDILDQHANHWAVLITHSYLYIDGTRVSPGDAHNPKIYPLGATANDGDDLWAKLVSRHANLHWVQNGHHVDGNVAYRADPGQAGNTVHQVFANWQESPNGGDGWMQLVTLSKQYARVQTFSPTLGLVNRAPGYTFTVEL
jgi:hypothetical protein